MRDDASQSSRAGSSRSAGSARSSRSSRSRIAVDVGGTFTDLVAWDDQGELVIAEKGLSTPAAMEAGVAAVVGATGEELIGRSEYFMHATTAGLNALLQRRGAPMALVTTAGFRDILEMRRGEREHVNDLLWTAPAPLVPRSLRFGVRERIDSHGRVVTPLDEAEVEALAARLADAGIETVAIVLLHSYANPTHERRVAEILRRCGYRGEISESHTISREFREYERTATTIADAYIRPLMSGYLDRLESSLRQLGFAGEPLVTASGGGAMSFGQARLKPVDTIMSGPVGGVVGAAAICEALGIDDAIAADVGGTSFDTCLILDRRPELRYEGRIDGLPIQTRWIDVRSVGAGGGSIAWVDRGGLLRAGPRSAGADPGPAAYGRGGVEPTATDAAVALGMFGPARLAGGVGLNRDLAEASLAPLATQLGMGITSVAEGVLTILTAAMSDAIRGITIERGLDPRGAALIAYGGAGPLFAGLIADQLGIARVVVPPHAGNFSAWGLLQQDVETGTSLTRVLPLSDLGLEAAAEVFDELAAHLTERGAQHGHGDLTLSASLDLRYSGQEYTLNLPTPELTNGGIAADEVGRRFAELYERTYGHVMEEEAEIVTVRAVGTRRLPKIPVGHAGENAAGESQVRRTFPAFSFRRREFDGFVAYDRGALVPGQRVEGPAVVLEPTSTTYLDHDFTAEVDSSGVLVVKTGVAR